VLDDGTEIGVDVVVEAVGSAPNVAGWTGTASTSPTACSATPGLRPIGPDGPLVTSAVAVGDIARFPNPLFDDVPRRVEHWNIPTETAKRAARVLLLRASARRRSDEPAAVPADAGLLERPVRAAAAVVRAARDSAATTSGPSRAISPTRSSWVTTATACSSAS
jgi:hypothetical protein